jgi:hypothetical protein
VGNFQSSLRDWSCRDEYPALRAGLSSTVPSGLVPIHHDGWLISSMAVQGRPIEGFSSDELGSSCIALAQEEIEVAALVGLQYGILK